MCGFEQTVSLSKSINPKMSESDPTGADNWPSIAQFYAKKDVFITGATGFMGKCLMEKLLRSCPDVGRIMILTRPKKGKTVNDRVESILSSKVSLCVCVYVRACVCEESVEKRLCALWDGA